MKLHTDNVKRAPFNRAKMVSAADYASALSVPGEFNWPKAARTLLLHLGLNFLLPLTSLVRSGDVKEEGRAANAADPDPLAAVGGSDTAYAVMRDALSPLHLYALGALPSVCVTCSAHVAGT